MATISMSNYHQDSTGQYHQAAIEEEAAAKAKTKAQKKFPTPEEKAALLRRYLEDWAKAQPRPPEPERDQPRPYIPHPEYYPAPRYIPVLIPIVPAHNPLRPYC